MVQIKEADLNDAHDQEAVVSLVDAYARDVMGNGQPLSSEVRSTLIAGLREHPTTHVLLAHDEGKPVGIAVCFRGFSTFAARPLLNIHDLAVIAEYRARGIGRQLLAAVEKKAKALGCCKLTLEVLEKNRTAKGLYEAVGFNQMVFLEEAGGALFMTKDLK